MKPAPAAAGVKGDFPALYGAVDELAKAASDGARPARAVFPVLGPAMPFLDEFQRDLLWECFRVPVYALLVDGGENVVGYECEVQEGLHLREDYAARLLFGRVEFGPCECGRPGPRLLPEKAVQPRVEAAAHGLVEA